MKIVFALIIAAMMSACSQIDTGNIGVESTLGQVKKETLLPGVHFTLFKRITEVSGKELLLQMNDLRPQTFDKINLADLDIDLYVQINSSKAPEIMTRWPGDLLVTKDEDGARLGINYVTRQAREAIYGTISKYKSDVVHTERVSIAADVVKSLQLDLDNSAGKDWFYVRSANVRNLLTDPALEAAIKEAATKQFQINAKAKEVELAGLEAERKRAEARGDADAIKLRAAAVTSQGGAEYVQLQAIAKWDGKLPVTNAGGALPFISVK
jgi:regulator of protease activity HflC (stomatin/prohibitin superfamily)